MTPGELASFAPDTGDCLDLARAIDGILSTVAPTAMLQWRPASGHDVVLLSDLGGGDLFVSEVTPDPQALRRAG